MLSDFASILVFAVAGVLLLILALTVARLIRPDAKTPEKLTTYECGEDPVGNPWIQFNIRFYIIALIFIIFEVEIVFLYPWGVVFKRLGSVAFAEMLVFIFILLVGLAYIWRKGDLEWVRPKPPYLKE